MKNIYWFLFFLLIVSNVYAKVKIDSNSVKIIKQGVKTEFTGNVKIRTPQFTVTSNKAISQRDKGTIEAYGAVSIKYSSDTWKLDGTCDRIFINETENSCIMLGNVDAVYTIAGEIPDMTKVRADEITLDYSDSQQAFFKGSVEVLRALVKVNAKEAHYSHSGGFIDFNGEPHAESQQEEVSTEYFGDYLKLFLNEEKIEIKGSAKAKVVFKDELKM